MKNLLTTLLISGTMVLGACGNTSPDTADTRVDDVAEASMAISWPELINPNTATAEQVTALPGLPADVAAALLEARPFADMPAFHGFLSANLDADGVDAVSRIIFMPMDLNTTPEADFMLIPGVGKKMAHEFEEYRPYADWAQFEREIGKYVDANEVARLRRFVTLGE